MTANMNFGPEWMRGGFSQPLNTNESQSTQSMLSTQTIPSTFTSNKENSFVSSPSVDNPYKYSKEFMLSLYCPSAPPQQFEHLPYVAVEESLGPLAFVDLSEEEKKLLAGPVHSESSRRVLLTNDKGNGQRHQHQHHRNDYHSTDNNRLMNRSKGRHGGEHQHRRLASSQSDVDGSKQSDSQFDSNSNNNNGNGNNSSWGGNDTLGSWDKHHSGNNNTSVLDKGWANRSDKNENASAGWNNRSENNESVSAGWNNRSESNENNTIGWTPTNSGNTGTSFKASTENGFKYGIDGPGFGESASLATEKSPHQYKWYYRDPSSNVQGPFEAQEMQEWYKAGFFGPSLWIRREDQDQFEPLAALVLKVGNEDSLFLSPFPKRPDFIDSFGASSISSSSAFPSSDSFSRMGPNNIFGNTVSPGIDVHSANFFDNSTGPDILHSGIGNKYSPFGNMLNSTPGSNGIPPMTNPLSGVSPFAPAFGRDPGTAPSWLNNSHPDLFGNSFQRQQQQQMMNPLFQNRNIPGFNNEPMDLQQHFMNVLQRQQHQQQQHHHHHHSQQQQQHHHNEIGLADQQLPQQPLFSQSQVLERLSNHASPVIRPAALSGWSSSPGTPLATEAPSSPWGSIVSPAIPHKMTEELQSKAPGQQSPRSHLSPQTHHNTLPTTNNNNSTASTTVSTAANSTTTTTSTTPTTSTSPKASSKTDTTNINKNNNDDDTTTLNESHWNKKPNSIIEENISSTLKKVSLHEIQQEQEREKKRKQEEEKLKKQKEKEMAAITAIAKQKAEKAQSSTSSSSSTTTEATPAPTKRMPEVPTIKPVSLRDIQAEELKIQEELKKQVKNNTVTKSVQSATSPTIKAGWSSGSGWGSETFKGPSLREIQEMEAKEAKLKKEAERKAAELQQSSTSSISTSSSTTTLSWGVVTPSKSQSVAHASNTTAPAWGSASAPKKTLREIQQEEEAAMKKKANKQQQQQQQATMNTKVGYANVASKPVVDTFDDASWTTVHNKPKQSSNHTSSSSISTAKNGWDVVGAPKKPVVINSGTTSVSRTLTVQQSKKSSDATGPSDSFKLWCKQSLRDLNAGVNADEILKMLLSFPLDNSVNEIIQDIIYANSSSMDGRRFAAEFMKRRRADMNNNDKVTSTLSSIMTPNTNVAEDDTFQVVNKKGRKTKAV